MGLDLATNLKSTPESGDWLSLSRAIPDSQILIATNLLLSRIRRTGFWQQALAANGFTAQNQRIIARRMSASSRRCCPHSALKRAHRSRVPCTKWEKLR